MEQKTESKLTPVIREAHAIVFPQSGQVELRPCSVPELAPDEFLVHTEFSGVSQGTEVWTYQGKRPELQFPTIPGYQSVGTIMQVGERVERYKVGQRVLVRTNRLSSDFPGTWMGAHASILVAKEAAIVPENCDSVGAAVCALAAVSLRGIRMINIELGDVVAVTGQGLIGQCSAQLAKLRGAIVIATDLNETRLKLSRKFSADMAVNVGHDSLRSAVEKLRPKGADAVIETTGRSDQFSSCAEVLRWEGHLLLQGWYPNPISFDFHQTHMKKPRIAVTCGFDLREVETCLSLLSYGKLKLRELVTHVVPVKEAPEIYAALSKGDESYCGVVFDWRDGF